MSVSLPQSTHLSPRKYEPFPFFLHLGWSFDGATSKLDDVESWYIYTINQSCTPGTCIQRWQMDIPRRTLVITGLLDFLRRTTSEWMKISMGMGK